ncbi:unnamed protein product, partial [Discosporangium mesarthrocarpum]
MGGAGAVEVRAGTRVDARAGPWTGVRGCSLAEPLVPMMLVPFSTLLQARRLPSHTSLAQGNHLVPYQDLEHWRSFVVFVSHRWVPDRRGGLRKNGRPGGEGGFSNGVGASGGRVRGGEGHGDGALGRLGRDEVKTGARAGMEQEEEWGVQVDSGSLKYGMVVEALQQIKNLLPEEVVLYVWMDWACLDQEDLRFTDLGAQSIGAYLGRCDAVLTPYAEKLYQAPPLQGGSQAGGGGGTPKEDLSDNGRGGGRARKGA